MTLKRIVFWVAISSMLVLFSGCNINLIQLNKRLERWEKSHDKWSSEKKHDFAMKSLAFYLGKREFHRTKELILTEAERLHYQQRMSSMQVFLIDYYASRALDFLNQANEDWGQAGLNWARADTLVRGNIPGHPGTFKMVYIQDGYAAYIRLISGQGIQYKAKEQQFPGLMAAYRKMSEYQFRLAEKLSDQGSKDEALEHYLLVFKYDPEHYAQAVRKVKYLTGQGIRETDVYREHRNKKSSNAADVANQILVQFESDLANMGLTTKEQQDKLFDDMIKYQAETYQMTVEQAEDLYYYAKNQKEGRLNEYLDRWQYQILKGQVSKVPKAM